MNNNRKYLFIVVFFLFSSIDVLAQSESQDLPLLTQQINRGEVLVSAGSAVALVPNTVSVVPVISSVTSSDNCAWYQVQCFQGESPTALCQCHNFWCDAGWTQGPCPNPP